MRVAISRDGESFGDPIIVPTATDFNDGVAVLKKIALELSGRELIKIAVGGVPGILNRDRSVLLSAPNLKEWENKPIKSELERVLGATVNLENDASLAALGEAVYGAGKDKRIVAYLTISTGVGGARVVDGKIDVNAFGFEPGRQIIDGGESLEYYIAGASLAKRSGEAPKEISDFEVWDETTKRLACGINNMIAFWSPDIIVLGGPIMKHISIDKVRIYLEKMLEGFPYIPDIVLAQLGDINGLYGALVHAKYLDKNP